MLEVIEGKPPLPRWFPPYEHGLFAADPQLGWEATHVPAPAAGPNPTLVNNVETLSNVPHILARGRRVVPLDGNRRVAGTVVATVVGDVVAPRRRRGRARHAARRGDRRRRQRRGARAGGSRRCCRAWPTRSSPPADLDVPVSYEGFAAIGSGMGAAGFIVYDDTACMVDVAYQLSRFLYVESCGQCPPCKLGSRRDHRSASSARDRCRRRRRPARHRPLAGPGHRRQPLLPRRRGAGAGAAASCGRSPTSSREHIEGGPCPRPRPLPIPKLLDLADGMATYDETFWRKRPDWTYEPDEPPSST